MDKHIACAITMLIQACITYVTWIKIAGNWHKLITQAVHGLCFKSLGVEHCGDILVLQKSPLGKKDVRF